MPDPLRTPQSGFRSSGTRGRTFQALPGKGAKGKRRLMTTAAEKPNKSGNQDKKPGRSIAPETAIRNYSMDSRTEFLPARNFPESNAPGDSQNSGNPGRRMNLFQKPRSGT